MARHQPTDDARRDHRILGRALRQLRDNAGMTQDDLARQVGIGATYVSQIENGHRGIGWHTVTRILRALDADLQQLAAEYDRQASG